MADALSVVPAAVLRNLSDKLYEKRKNAALEVEGIVKQLAMAGDHDKITAVINLLTNEYTYSPQANHRKGGLIGLAAATVGLTSEAAQHLDQIVPPVLNSFADQDSRVRYYACEALYNIAKVVRGDFIVFFNQIFDALCKLSADSDANVQSAAHLLDRLVKDIVTESDQFSIEEFIPLLRERMNVLNPYVRQFLVGWITVLDSVPDIDMLGFLPDFLDGLFNMLSDSSHEIRQQADSALSEFLQEIKNSPSVDYGRMAEILVQRAASPDEFTRLTAITWINEFVKLGGDQLVPHYADILGAILPCISDKEEKIRVVARETNEELRGIQAAPGVGFDVGAILSVARRHLSSEWEATRIEALHWISTLLNRHREGVLSFLSDVFETLLKALSDPSDEVSIVLLENHEPPILACALNEVLLKLTGDDHSPVPTLIVPFVVPESKLKQENRYSGKRDKVSLYGMKLGPKTDLSELLSSRLQQSPPFSQILHEELALLLHLVNVKKLPTVVMIGVTGHSTSSKNSKEELEVTCQIGEHLASVSSLTFSKEKMVQSPTKTSRDGQEAWRALYG